MYVTRLLQVLEQSIEASLLRDRVEKLILHTLEESIKAWLMSDT